MRQFGQGKRKYHWTPELHGMLKRAYCGNKPQLGRALDALMKKTGWPRHALTYEAIRLGIVTADHRRPWTLQEIVYISERLPSDGIKRVAKALKRSVGSVQAKAERISISSRVSEGYTIADLSLVFGEHCHKIARWMDRGLFGRVQELSGRRVGERAVAEFLRRHHCEYDLRRIDGDWFKAMVFGYLAEYGSKV
jgi:hypothetical protein